MRSCDLDRSSPVNKKTAPEKFQTRPREGGENLNPTLLAVGPSVAAKQIMNRSIRRIGSELGRKNLQVGFAVFNGSVRVFVTKEK